MDFFEIFDWFLMNLLCNYDFLLFLILLGVKGSRKRGMGLKGIDLNMCANDQ